MITDGQARRIAAEWHSPNTGMSALSHTGLIDDRVELEIEREIHQLWAAADAGEYTLTSLRDLRALLVYVTVTGHRTTVEGWSRLWDEAPVAEPVRVPVGHHVDGCCETCGRFDGQHDRDDCFK